MKVKFHGTRGSFPLVREEGTSLNSQQTSCVELQSDSFGDKLFFLDAGSGLNNALCRYLDNFKQINEIHILLSHTHWDHIAGLASLYPWFKENKKIYFYSGFENIEQRVEGFFNNYYWPVPRGLYLQHIKSRHLEENSSMEILNAVVSCKKHKHPGGCYSYSINLDEKKLLYCTDIELHGDLQQLGKGDYYQNHDLVIIDTHLAKLDTEDEFRYGHSSMQEAIEFATITKSRTMCFTHHNPLMANSHIEESFKETKNLAQKNNIQTILASDGLILDL